MFDSFGFSSREVRRQGSRGAVLTTKGVSRPGGYSRHFADTGTGFALTSLTYFCCSGPPLENAIRGLRPSLGNGRLPDFHRKSSGSYAAKTKTASECGEVPMRGSKYCHYLIVIFSLYE
jgi:hypothetical protein